MSALLNLYTVRMGYVHLKGSREGSCKANFYTNIYNIAIN